MKIRRGRSSGLSFIISIIVAMLIGGIFLMIAGAGGFFGKLSYGIADYNSVAEADLKKNLPVQGTIYYIYDCIVTEYSTDDNGNQKADAFYYAVPFDNNTVLIVKVKANSALETEMDKLYKAQDDSTYEYMFTSGVALNGILEENDSEVLRLFDDWKDTYKDSFKKAYNIDISNFSTVSYTLNCTSSLSALSGMFIGGLIMVLVVVALIILFIVKYMNGGNKGYTPTPQFAGGYGNPNNTGTNGYILTPSGMDTSQQNNNTGTFGLNKQPDTSGTAQQNSSFGFGNTQQNTGYGTTGQQNNSFGFGATQQNTGYGTTGQQNNSFGFGNTQQNTGYCTTGQQNNSFGFGNNTQQNTGYGTTGQQNNSFGFGNNTQQNTGSGFGAQPDNNGFGKTVMPNDLNNNK